MYREENNQVILAMSRDDYDWLLKVFAVATAAVIAKAGIDKVGCVLDVLNRLNQGNPNYTPYQLKPDSPGPSR